MMQFIAIKPGSFLMGSPKTEIGRRFDEILHSVELTNPYFMQEATVTVGQWRSFVNDTQYKTTAEKRGTAWQLVKKSNWNFQWLLPRFDWEMIKGCYWDNPGFQQTESHPVTCVSFVDTQAFIEWKTKTGNKTFRLPTEAEWEYACRAGTQTAFSFGNKWSSFRMNCAEGIHAFNKRYRVLRFMHNNQRTALSKSYHPNPWGFYNMHGNVWEWCLDQCGSGHEAPITFTDGINNPVCTIGDGRILKGGSWAYPSRFCRSASRRILPPEYAAVGIGFRLVYC